ncbi:MAG: hypothetical protein NUK63_03425 [Candidatus Bathyarchaeum tardum]|nr:MAG: hypothetical protein NUK63_03425 [Candidatus Bathyarchaeum tardum]
MEKNTEESEKRNPAELIKEAIRRANKKEKQEWTANFVRRLEISKRLKEISLEIKRLDQQEKEIEVPERRRLTGDKIFGMSTEELQAFNEMMEEHNKKLSIWNEKYAEISAERMKLYEESTKLHIEFLSLENEEKWILLSIVLRSQPTLMNYI